MNPIQIRVNNNSFTKQLMSMIDGIIYYKSKSIFIIEPFSDIPISKIFNMDKLYTFFKENYNIHVFDSQELLSIKVFYQDIDVTSQFLNDTLNNSLCIPKDFLDGITPLTIIYNVNGITLEQTYTTLEEDYVYVNCIQSKLVSKDKIYGKSIKEFQDHVLENIEYLIEYLPQSKVKLIYDTTIVNCIHLKLDTPNKNLEQKYIQLIEENFKKYFTILVFSKSKSNRVIDFLENENYVYEISEYENPIERTIVDILRSKFCNNIFIGNSNSTFSYYIQILNKVNTILI